MIITALDTSFNAVAVVEAYMSFIWTDRYDDVGDFELYVPASAPYLDKIRNDFYLACSETVDGTTQRLMIVEKIEYKTDLEDGNSVVISGRSLESILDRRIVWKDDGSVTEINKMTIHEKIPSIGDATWADEAHKNEPFPLQNGIQFLLEMNAINPSNANRLIGQLKFIESTDTRITSLTMTPCAYRGNSLYDLIRGLCDMFSISFRIYYDETDEAHPLVFQLYKGLNHLSSQTENGYVCFSTEYDNLLSSDSSLDMTTYKTMAYFVGQGEQWAIKEYSNTELCYTGWIREYNHVLYACKQDYDTHNVQMPRPSDKTPPNDPDNWALITDWDRSVAYTAGSYVTFYSTYDIEVYRIDHDIVRYSTATTYSMGSVVMDGSGSSTCMYVSYKDNNTNHAVTDAEWWYKCKNDDECFTAQDWTQLQEVQKETYDLPGDVQNNATSGLDRRELYVDVSNVPSSYTYYPDGQKEKTYILDRGIYEATLKDKALSELTVPGYRPTKNFDCEVETNVSFKYGRDYGIGDVIEVKDTYGFVDSVVVNSYIISHNESGEFKAYPTFETVESSTIVTKYLTLNQALSTGTFLLKVPESTRFDGRQIIAESELRDAHGTLIQHYYLMSFVKKITSDSTFAEGRSKRELHMIAWTTDTNVIDDWSYQTQEQALTVGPAVVGTPMFYIDIEGDVTLPAVINPSWLPPITTDLGTTTVVHEDHPQYKNILLANL